MDNWTFGITMTVVGTGATFIILGILVFVIDLLKRAFPLSAGPNPNEKAKGA
jgi:Na+-transporting methylmalonyl-CoA/oxaloacetate decarboxylase gamma subunit